MELLEGLEQLTAQGERAVVATLVRTEGTSPRKEGARMWVGADGRIMGSVTIGGCVDAQVIGASDEVLTGERPRLLSLALGDEEAWELGLSCAGHIDVFVEPVRPGGAWEEKFLTTLREARRDGRSLAVATLLAGPGTIGGKLLLLDGEIAAGGLGDPALDTAVAGAAARLLAQGLSRTVEIQTPQGAAAVFIESFIAPPTLLVVGASHVAIPLVSIARTLGYRTTVVDARPRFATRQRFPDADQLLVGIPSELVQTQTLDERTALVLVAHDYKYDIPALKLALQSSAGYIGLLGSRRRGKAILDFLREDGVAGEALERIRVPIGLDIGAQTAEEIAIAILAEILATRYGRSGGPLRGRAEGG